MTIAIGLLAKDGIVVAADTQTGITDYLKMSQGKIALGSRLAGDQTRPAIAVAGAGNSAYFDAMWQLELDHFHSLESHFEIEVFEQGLRERIEEFYNKHVIPFSPERPDLQLVIAAQSQNGKRRLWYTENNLLIPCDRHGTIGIGGMYAKILLDKSWTHELDLKAALLLASYVIYHTKQNIDGCGQDTTMVYLSRGATWAIGRELAGEIEEVFKEHSRFEAEALRYAIRAERGDDKHINAGINRIRLKLQKAISKVELLVPEGPTGDR